MNTMINLDLMMCAVLGRRLLCKLKKYLSFTKLFAGLHFDVAMEFFPFHFSWKWISVHRKQKWEAASDVKLCCTKWKWIGFCRTNRIIIKIDWFRSIKRKFIFESRIKMLKWWNIWSVRYMHATLYNTMYIAILLTERISRGKKR